MENFKFIANTSNFNKNIEERNVYEFDILSLIQYMCLIDILQKNGIEIKNNKLVTLPCYEISICDGNLEQDDLKSFIFQYKFFSIVSDGNKNRIFWCNIPFDNDTEDVFSCIINIVLDDMIKNDFDKYIDIHQNNKYNLAKYHTNDNDHKIAYLTVCFDHCLDIRENKYHTYTKDLRYTNDRIPFVTGDYLNVLINEYQDHSIKSGLQIENTMSDNIVYTSDLEVTKQVLRNNQKIINNAIKNLKLEPDLKVFDSNKQKLMRLLTAGNYSFQRSRVFEEMLERLDYKRQLLSQTMNEDQSSVKAEVKPKQRVKITL